MKQRIVLSEKERFMILTLRAEQQKAKQQKQFVEKALQVASKWLKWSNKTGNCLTFSTFVNDFGYEHEDSREIYYAVKNIICFLRENEEKLGFANLGEQ